MSENKENPACAFQKPDPEAPMFTFDHKNEKLDVEISDLAKLKAVPDRLGRIEKKIDLVSHFTYTLKEDQKKILQNQELLLHQPTAMEKEMLRLLKWVVMFNEEFKRPNISDIMDEGTEEEK